MFDATEDNPVGNALHQTKPANLAKNIQRSDSYAKMNNVVHASSQDRSGNIAA
jgi:hypothetical protein